MAAVEQETGAAKLCREADGLLEAGEVRRATVLFMAAFNRQAGTTVTYMRGMGGARLAHVISTLEAWLETSGEDGQNRAQGVNRGLAAVFLSTLSHNNISAMLFKMESLLQNTGPGCREVISHCSALLERRSTVALEGPQRMAVELTRALACLLSEPQSPKGLELYTKAYREYGCKAVRLVKSRQIQHLPKIVAAFMEQLTQVSDGAHSETQPAKWSGDERRSDSAVALDGVSFLASIMPGDPRVQELRAETLFHLCRFEESAEAFSAAIQGRDMQSETSISDNRAAIQQISPEKSATFLVGRAAASFCAGGQGAEACRNLALAFGTHPAVARRQFQRLFSHRGTGAAVRAELRLQAERGLSQYKELVLARADLRSSEGTELLEPVIAQLRTLCHLEPDGGARELRVRLADCLLLRGESWEALSICSQLASTAPTQRSYQNTVHVLRGYARFLSGDHQGALDDFQAVIEHCSPHPSSCVRALCGRGLIRMLAGSHYLTALDYVTASRLQLQDAALTMRCLVPWNYRGLLCTVLLEQGRVMLEKVGTQGPTVISTSHPDHKLDGTPQTEQEKEGFHFDKEGMSVGVHALAVLLTELEPGADGPRLLAADALYRLRRAEEAHRLLLSSGHALTRAPLLARLTLLQLHRGFHYDANQLLKKLMQCGDTSCLLPLLAVTFPEDRTLLRGHCHAAAERILVSLNKDCDIREAVAYLSIAIIASGGEAADSLLARARCYTLLGQHKTAIFDFSAILREHTEHVQALCGRGFTYLILKQQKECTTDILAALQVNADVTTREILSLKDKAKKLISDWLQQYCRTKLSQVVAANPVPCGEEPLREAFLIGGALMKSDCHELRWHLLYIDTLIAKGDMKAASAHLSQVFGQDSQDAEAQARWGVVEAWRRNFRRAAKGLSAVAETDAPTLDFVLALLNTAHRKPVAQAAAHEAGYFSLSGQWEQALSLLTVAVCVSSEGRLLYWRQRATCLARLGLHERAVSDMDHAIRALDACAYNDSEVWAEDLCRRGRSLLMSAREEAGLEDFARALELNASRALHCAEEGPGVEDLAERFLQAALQRFAEQQLGDAWRLTESGLRLQDGHTGLRRLRARIKREAAGSCIVH